MPPYITLMRFAQKGAEDITHGPDRVSAATQRVHAAGGEIKAFDPTMGRYDAAAIVEAPNDAAAAKNLPATAAQGTVRTEILRAFTEDEYRRIVSSLP
jgi:uncharacterized protein with GYD domain